MKLTFAALTVVLLSLNGCAPAPASPASSPSIGPSPAPAVPSVAPMPSGAVVADKPAPDGLLVRMSAASHPGYDRLVLEFGGDKPPAHELRWVDEVRHDPTDRPVPLRGKHFLLIVCDGGTLDTTRVENDPSEARRYAGPDRIAADLALLKEVAIAGDFEAVLSFGAGLDRKVEPRVQILSSPARIVIDFHG